MDSGWQKVIPAVGLDSSKMGKGRQKFTYQREPGVSLRLPPAGMLSLWLKKIIAKEKRNCSQISFVFCGDKRLLALNKKFLHHNYFTDVITFDYTEGATVSGEVFISIERVKENANAYGQLFSRELLRTIAHGVLHLCGYNDKTAEDTEVIRAKEEEALVLFQKLNAKRLRNK